MKKVLSNFPNILKILRKKENITQLDLAKELNTTQSKISELESGSLKPSLEFLISLADFFDITIDELVGRER